MADKDPEVPDELAESLNDLFISLSSMVKSELQGTNNILELLEKMNVRVADEYKGFGDVASGLRVFVEQLKKKSGNFDEYVQQIDAIEQQVTEFEAVISVLDRYGKEKDEDGLPSRAWWLPEKETLMKETNKIGAFTMRIGHGDHACSSIILISCLLKPEMMTYVMFFMNPVALTMLRQLAVVVHGLVV
ncbi:hypothetical protein V6N11_019738 [Hibiscus sabdariffa]|uniref:Biogenesis of lysosome-related organelles complex 1 subunit 2 n=1 Tax=Hibiscus sabdariffa TaxID=183260 RepID=A0ABR2NLX2_9ROSI